MSFTTTAPARSTTESTPTEPRLTVDRVVASEPIKQRTLRSTWTTLAGVLLMLVGFAALAATGATLAILVVSVPGVLVGGVLFLPTIASSMLPSSREEVLTYLPSNAESSFTSVTAPDGMLTAGTGALVFAARVVLAVIGAAMGIKRRDA